MGTSDNKTIEAFRREYATMKREALKFVKGYFSDDDSVRSVKLGSVIWTHCDGEERTWEEGKPSDEDLIEWGDLEVGFEIVIASSGSDDVEDYTIYSYFDGATFKNDSGEFDLEIR